MSLTIKNEKFTIFGSGYEQTRNDSGEGMKEPDYYDLSGMNLACIDETGTYVWLTDEGNWLHKIKIDTWEFQSHSLPIGSIYHPSNVENNYGIILIGGNRTVIFDLTSGEIIKDITASHSWISGICDCILVDDDIHIIKCYPQNVDTAIIHISLENETVTESILSNRCTCGFADNDTIYAYYSKAWFYQNSGAGGYGLTGSTQWETWEDYSNQVSFNVNLHGLCRNGRIYVPTPNGDKWSLGVYNGNSAPDFVTPTPIKKIGSFASSFDFQWSYSNVNYCYNQGKTKACFATNIGTYYTDFEKVQKLEETPSNMRPLAMNDKIIVSRVGNNQVSVFYL